MSFTRNFAEIRKKQQIVVNFSIILYHMEMKVRNSALVFVKNKRTD